MRCTGHHRLPLRSNLGFASSVCDEQPGSACVIRLTFLSLDLRCDLLTVHYRAHPVCSCMGGAEMFCVVLSQNFASVCCSSSSFSVLLEKILSHTFGAFLIRDLTKRGTENCTSTWSVESLCFRCCAVRHSFSDCFENV